MDDGPRSACAAPHRGDGGGVAAIGRAAGTLVVPARPALTFLPGSDFPGR